MVRIFKHYVPTSLLLLGIFESLLLMSALFLADAFLGPLLQDVDSTVIHLTSPDFSHASLLFLVVFGALMAMGLYRRRLSCKAGDWLSRTTLAFLVGGLVVYGIFSLMPGVTLDWGIVWTAIFISFIGVVFFRFIFSMVADKKYLNRRILVLGTGEMALEVTKLRRKSDYRGCAIIGFVNVSDEEELVERGRILKKEGSLFELVEANFIDELVVAVIDQHKTLPVDELLECKVRGVRVIDLPYFFERQLGLLRLDIISPDWIVFSDGFKSGLLKDVIKRSVDLGVSLAMLLIVWPIMLLTAMVIFISSKGRGTVFYKQLRVGEMGVPFEVIKFRSMRMDAEKNGAQWASENDNRVTTVGKFIRKTRIDELPQLINVLRGDMSFVGPRPERPEFVEQLAENIPYFNDRHMVKPGITGWAQIGYPYGASEDDSRKKLQYDLYYVKNYSLFLDFTIIMQTAEVILWGRGAR
ncbi:FIG071646: Sugar transferase [hydrothermal vent metagenome]|uniref:FIG071646: Sugar transferase n=1 Tax=hydrothermal vent metagenome TaxID=652676 RepID=A0A3B0YUV2_9ZZZZ